MNFMFMPFKRYAEFSGRSRRMEFWMWQLFLFGVGIVFWVMLTAVGGAALASGDPNSLAAAGGGLTILFALYFLFGLVTLIPNIAVTVRRLHDTNRTGWWILAPIVPYIVAFVGALGGMASGSQGGMAAGGMISLVATLALFVLGIVLLVFMFMEGTRGPNKYGEDPKLGERGHADTFA
jgi:uncharacterized membrane protein YhaH (DUF805 family)